MKAAQVRTWIRHHHQAALQAEREEKPGDHPAGVRSLRL